MSGPSSSQVALLLFGAGANDAIRGQMEQYGQALSSLGIPVVLFDAGKDDAQTILKMVSNGEISFALSWLGIGQDLAGRMEPPNTVVNIWEHFDVPLLKLQADSPAYFSARHADTPRNAVNLYGPREFLALRLRWLRTWHALSAVVSPMPLDPCTSTAVDGRLRRGGRLVFLKNGNSPEELCQLWSERLHPFVADLLNEAAREVVEVGCSCTEWDIGQFVADFLSARGIAVGDSEAILLLFVAQLDDYLRRVKSRMIAQALLDFPVIVQGAFWHHLDFTGRRATLVPGQDYAQSRDIYRTQLGIIDMSPNVDTSPHERAQRAAGSHTLLLTNSQTWLRNLGNEFSDLMFQFSTEAICDRIASVLASPARYLELAIHYGNIFKQTYPSDKFAREVVQLAQLAKLRIGDRRPQLQNYFGWPSLLTR